jgi:hypothetical protein
MHADQGSKKDILSALWPQFERDIAMRKQLYITDNMINILIGMIM